MGKVGKAELMGFATYACNVEMGCWQYKLTIDSSYMLNSSCGFKANRTSSTNV